MNQLLTSLLQTNVASDISKETIFKTVITTIKSAGYEIVEINDARPWGGYIRMNNSQADTFVKEFFPDLTLEQARLGMSDVELSPKILIVAPNQRLSWQYHNRRAERWRFITPGIYYKSSSNEMGKPVKVMAGDVIQFQKGDRHRLVGLPGSYSLVAEIWQHLDKTAPSNEEDIVRLADDYKR